MYKKTITYEDFNGNTRTEDFYFNLTRSELIKLEVGRDGGLDTYLQKIVDAKDAPEIMDAFENIILSSYGVKSDDGRTFKKSKEISADFANTNAYDKLYTELCTDSDAAAAFVNGIMPKLTDTGKKKFDLVADQATSQQSVPAPVTTPTITPTV